MAHVKFRENFFPWFIFPLKNLKWGKITQIFLKLMMDLQGSMEEVIMKSHLDIKKEALFIHNVPCLNYRSMKI